MAQLEKLVAEKMKTLQLIVDTRGDGGEDAAKLLVSIEQERLEMDHIKHVVSEMEILWI